MRLSHLFGQFYQLCNHLCRLYGSVLIFSDSLLKHLCPPFPDVFFTNAARTAWKNQASSPFRGAWSLGAAGANALESSVTACTKRTFPSSRERICSNASLMIARRSAGVPAM